MAVLSRVVFPQGYVPDPNIGRPVSNGYIYVGQINTDPVVVGNQINVTAEKEDGSQFTIPQPIRTSIGGVPTYNGSPVILLLDQAHSLKVLDSNSAQIYYAQNISTAETAASDYSLDAGSWANEDEDVPVKEYTAGVGTDRVPTVFSAKHYWAKITAMFASIVQKTSSTGAAIMPVGTTAQRDGVPLEGYMRRNTDLKQFEGYTGTDWEPVGAGASGGVGNPVFYENDTNVTADYTITTGKNAMSAGPITIDAGVTVTVPTGSVWAIV